MSQRKIVSQTSYVKPHKQGEIRSANSAEARYDASTSSKIEQRGQTRSYTKIIGNVAPTAPSVERIIEHTDNGLPSRKNRSRSRARKPKQPLSMLNLVRPFKINPIPLVIAALCVLLYMLVPNDPETAVLDRLSWTFSGQVYERQYVVETGWNVPTDAFVIRQEQYQRGTKTVVYGHTEQCAPVTETRQVYSHTEQVCNDYTAGWTDELELYSHTNEVCYDDGTCEEEDVYSVQPAQPITETRCVDVERYTLVPYTRNECTQVPLTREEPVFDTWSTYGIWRWKYYKTFYLESADQMTPEDMLEEDQRYETQNWRYYLHFDNDTIVKRVDKETYDAHLQSVGTVVNVPWNCVWC